MTHSIKKLIALSLTAALMASVSAAGPADKGKQMMDQGKAKATEVREVRETATQAADARAKAEALAEDGKAKGAEMSAEGRATAELGAGNGDKNSAKGKAIAEAGADNADNADATDDGDAE